MKIENFKQLLEDVFAVEHIHSNKRKIIVRTDVFEEGLILEKVIKNCAMMYLNNYDYSTNGVGDGSFQIIYFPITEKELDKRFKAISSAINKNQNPANHKGIKHGRNIDSKNDETPSSS